MSDSALSPADISRFVQGLRGRNARLSTVFQDGHMSYNQTGIIGDVVVATGPTPPGVLPEKAVRVTSSTLTIYRPGQPPQLLHQGDNVWRLPNHHATLDGNALVWHSGGDFPGVPDRIDFRLELLTS